MLGRTPHRGIGSPLVWSLCCLLVGITAVCADVPSDDVDAIPGRVRLGDLRPVEVGREAPGKFGDRPTYLPDYGINVKRDLMPLVRENELYPPKKQAPTAPKSDYDHSRMYLPERNPGSPQLLTPSPPLPFERYWTNVDFLLAWTQNMQLPSLATTGGRGVIGQQGTRIAIGDGEVDYGVRSGLRVNSGFWMDRDLKVGFEGSFLFLETGVQRFHAETLGDTILARPFVSGAQVGQARVLGGQGTRAGMTVQIPSSLLGFDANYRGSLFSNQSFRLDAILGYRMLRLSEALEIRTASLSPNGVREEAQDSFATSNHFHGASLGLRGEYRTGDWFIDGGLKVALGVSVQRVDIVGATIRETNFGTTTTSGGFLAQDTNMGRRRATRFAVSPECSVGFGLQLTDNWRARLGYSFLYLSDIARPTRAVDQIFQAGVRPAPLDANAAFWLHTLQLGLEARY